MSSRQLLAATLLGSSVLMVSNAFAADTIVSREEFDALQVTVGQLNETLMRRGDDTGVAVHGFADVGWARADKDFNATAANGFTWGNFDLYLAPQLGDRVKGLLETVIEHDDMGGIALDLERIQVGYSFSDKMTVWVGRFHTPYGYWNTAFHHGAQIQTSALRPKFLDFEDKGGILPAHSTGLWTNGQISFGANHLHYDLYVSNGNKIEEGVLNMNQARDDNYNANVGLNLSFSFHRVLTLGIHGMQQQVDAYDASGEKVAATQLLAGGAYAYLSTWYWEGIAEYYTFNNKDLLGNTGTHKSIAAIAQLGLTVHSDITPYYRAEFSNLDRTDGYFNQQESGYSYRRQALGVRYDVNAKMSFKIEVNNTRQEEAAGWLKYNELRTLLAIAF